MSRWPPLPPLALESLREPTIRKVPEHWHQGRDLDPAFGEIYVAGNSTETTISVQDTWYQVTVFDTNGASNDASPDHTNDHITIDVAGLYLVVMSASAKSGTGSSAVYECEIKKNNGAVDLLNLHWDRQLSGGGGDVGSTSISGLASFVADDTIEMWVRNVTNTTNILFEDINLSVVQLSRLPSTAVSVLTTPAELVTVTVAVPQVTVVTP